MCSQNVQRRERPHRPVCVINAQRRVRLDAPAIWALAALTLDARAPSPTAGVNLMFVRDPAIRRYNREFFGKDTPTDVISFPAGAADGAGRPCAAVGDVVISIDQALAYGSRHAIAPAEELARYVVHGILHCLGYDDISAGCKRIMFRHQEALVAAWKRTGRLLLAGPNRRGAPGARRRSKGRAT